MKKFLLAAVLAVMFANAVMAQGFDPNPPKIDYSLQPPSTHNDHFERLWWIPTPDDGSRDETFAFTCLYESADVVRPEIEWRMHGVQGAPWESAYNNQMFPATGFGNPQMLSFDDTRTGPGAYYYPGKVLMRFRLVNKSNGKASAWYQCLMDPGLPADPGQP